MQGQAICRRSEKMKMKAVYRHAETTIFAKTKFQLKLYYTPSQHWGGTLRL